MFVWTQNLYQYTLFKKILLPTIYLVFNWSDSTYQKFHKDAGRLY